MNRTRAAGSRPHPARFPLILAAVACAAAVALTGCASGEGYGTETQVAAVNGASGDVGPIAVRNAVFSYPDTGDAYHPGAKVPLMVAIINTGDDGDALVKVTTPVARGVAVAGQTKIAAGHMVTSLNDPDNELAPIVATSPAASASPSATPTTPSPKPSPKPSAGASELAIPDSIDGGELRIVLTNLTQPLRPGLTYPVTFHFRDAGNITLPVPLSHPGGTIGQPGAGIG